MLIGFQPDKSRRYMNRLQSIIWLLAVDLLLAGCSPFGLFAPKVAQPAAGIDPSRKASVTKGTIESTLIAPGKLIAQASATVVFPLSSQVLAIAVKVGDRVKAGQPLITLDSAELALAEQQARAGYLDALATYSLTLKGPNPSAIKAARAALTSAQTSHSDLQRDPGTNEVASQKATLANSEAMLRNAQSAYDKARREDPAGIGAAPEGLALEQATNVLAADKAAYARLFEKSKPGVIASSVAQIAAARANLDALTNIVTETVLQAQAKADFALISWQSAQHNLKKAVVVAPIDGMVVAIAAQKGESVSAGARALEIADFASPIFEASVDEADVGAMRIEQEAHITIQAYPDQTFAATVQEIAPTGAIASNVVTFKVQLAIAESAGARPGEGVALLPGMSGKGEVVVGRAEDALVITTSLLTRDPSTDEFTVQRILPGDKVETVKVQTGINDESMTEITQGLSEGDVLLAPLADANTAGIADATPTPSFELLPAGGGIGGGAP
jgi:HlyD family secretion protein